MKKTYKNKVQIITSIQKIGIFIYLSSLFLLTGCNGSKKEQLILPVKEVVDNYHGYEIKDPYRYLEHLEDTLVQRWLKKQGNYARKTIDKIPKRQYLIEQQIAFDKKKTADITYLRVTNNDRYFYLKRKPDEDVGKLYYRNSFQGEEILLYDPVSFKTGSGNKYLINYIKPSWNGNKIVISLTKNGEEISEMIIIDIKTGKPMPQIIDHCWPSGTGGIDWLPDDSGFIYQYHTVIDSKSDNFLLNTKAVLYKLGQDPKNINEIFSNENNPELDITNEDIPFVYIPNQKSKYLFGNVANATPYYDAYYTFIEDIEKPKSKWKPLFKSSDNVRSFILDGDYLIYRTSKNAPNFQICKTSVKAPDFNNPEILVKEKKDTVISGFTITKEGLFFVTTKNGVESKLFHLKDTREINIMLPNVSASVNVSSKGKDHSDLWVYTRGWTSNNTRYSYNITSNTFTESNLAPLPEYSELNDVVVEELTVKSHDGTEVPLSLIYNKKLKKDKSNPVLIRGYGAYGYSVPPRISTRLLSWVKEGGIYAFAHVRGGGEKGDGWYKGGFKTTKPNTWKDLIACTEYLIDEKYTSNKKTVIWSASAGGILIGRAITERPDLYAAAIVEVGMLNAIRSETAPNGPNNIKEFGTVKDSTEFKALLEMDAYHHIKDGESYPATLITAGMNDPRVIAWEPAKFAVRLQSANSSNNNPILFLYDSESGHGFDDSRMKSFEKLADILSFAFWQTGHPDYQYQEPDTE